ncbi:bifunctional helix-turn-helix transcriptional regulator/GNAT family N-acetyltransferase [Actinocrispum wychmicini]|uniref:DNA-binding MarR family transcriptional regulator n=1 Tax=Actinocrispum wychmicini TaxID=1213861 RepID=A0A4R2KE19_9PSEU|nr:bifunctional helix-turn-helix transcriptional regulator/GNAT family N-acetyltransferase [Actinocrispum wychmicini]TCO64765.1 DNA-binding MarR family transcriptional regulator [Actinocrispum wychmicini]
MIPAAHVSAVRKFNRCYTKILGMLAEGLVDTPYSLTEARVLFELNQRDDLEVTALRRDLDLDAGYLSRLLARFETDGLIVRDRAKTDARRQVISLTEAGRTAAKMLDDRASEQVQNLLAQLSEDDQRQLVDAMDVIRERLDRTPKDSTVVLRPPRPGDFGWVIERNGAIYAQEYGWGVEYEALVARIVADYAADNDPTREAAWIAEVNGERVGCVFCVRKDDATAKLRLLLVEPSARGLGVGGRLVDECVRFATSIGYRTIELWTNSVLSAARRIYTSRGFTVVKSEPHHGFEPDLVAETWALDLGRQRAK